MSYLNDGPLMADYNPGWKQKFEETRTLVCQLEKRQRESWSDDLASVVSQLHREIPTIFLSQFRTVLDFEKFQREQHWRRAKRLGMRLPDISADATEEDVLTAYKRFRALADRVEAYRRLPKPEEWGNGLFAKDKPDHVRREIETVPVDMGEMVLQAHLIIEHHPDGIHVCVVEDPLSPFTVLSSVSGFKLAGYLAQRFGSKKPGWFRQLPGARPKDVFVYKFFSPLSIFAPGARVYPCQLVFDGMGGVRLDDLPGLKLATPLMMEELIALPPENRID